MMQDGIAYVRQSAYESHTVVSDIIKEASS